jgi:hypothetical protein
VVVPRTIGDVVATLAACRQFCAPILARGCGTSLKGQCCNVAVVLDCSKYLNRILELDPDRKQARVEPGVICDQLRDAAEQHGLTFGPDPATHNHCTLGGMIGNNSCGVHSVMAGKTDDNIDELEILTYDGLRLRVGATSWCHARRCAAAGRCTTTACCGWPGISCCGSSACCDGRSVPVCPSWCSNRAARRCSATSSARCSRTTPTRSG